ncbi:ketoacyl-synt-domain-containing protein [Xylariaceae sp. FL0662B]|nr:ketoacyl-synt-domain-containing protein [Xylariaceae sp. FL0662B]
MSFSKTHCISSRAADCEDITAPLLFLRLLVFSAFDQKAAQRVLDDYAVWYQVNKVSSDREKLDALAYMLAVRRNHMRWRSFAIASASEDETTTIETLHPEKPVRVASEPGLCWTFTGQGAQYVNMGWELIGMYTLFKETLKKVDEVYKELGCEWSIFDELQNTENIEKPEYSQPLSTAIQLALIELLRSFGITPKAVVGHSSGEIAAAYAIGALSLASACKVSYFRGRVAGKLRAINTSSPGAMISINLAPDEVPDFLSKIQEQETRDVSIACMNSPLNVTLSGPEARIDAIKAQAGQEGIFAVKLRTGVDYHSSSMRTGGDEYLSLMGSLEPDVALPIPMFSTVTGKSIAPAELTNGQYWVNNMISPVRFSTAVQLIASGETNSGVTDWVEIGPHPALKRYTQDLVGKDKKMHYLATLHRNHSATQKVLELAGTLFCRGHSISLTAVNNQQENETASTTPSLIDCPPYPFDHSNKFWSECRMSRDYRLRTPTKGGALGQRVTDWNPLQPRWRTFLSVETHPWIGHHVVGDLVLYPAAGMLILAMEAAQEMAPADRTVATYFIKEAHFQSPVIVPESWDDRIEVVVSLRPIENRVRDKEPSSNWSHITIFTYAKESHAWTEVFYASVQTQYASNAEKSERRAVDEATQEQDQRARETCNLPVDPQVLYGDAFEHGLQYGELFQLCQDIKWDKSGARAIATVPVRSSTKYETASFVHPSVLDTMFHVLRVSAGQQPKANVPVRLEDAWFSPTGWQAPSTRSVRWLASSKRRCGRAVRGEQGSVSALADDGTVLAKIEKLVTAAVSSDDTDPAAAQKTLLHEIEWKPQLSLLSARQLAEVCKADTFAHDPETMLSNHRKRTAVLNIAAVRMVRNVQEEQRAKLPSTLRHHVDWMENHVHSLSSEERAAAETLTNAEYEAQLDAFDAAFPTWALYPHVARALPAIIAGEVDPLEIIFESEYAKIFYASLFQPLCGDGRLSRFIDLAAHENPPLRILEVGAGTGGMTVHILNALREREKRTGAISFAEYMYTDITPVFFESAKMRWEAEGLGSRMSFRALDMECSVSSQGFAENSYDLLIAGSCVHATRLLSKTLQNLRRLLKPGGKLVLLEMTKPTDIQSCFFATLASGWWLSEEEARVEKKSPLVTDDEWDEILKQNGFSGNDIVLKDTKEGEAHIASIIASTALAETKAKPAPPLRRMFIINPQQNGQKTLAGALSKGLDTVIPLDQIGNTPIGNDDIVVSLVEVDSALLASLSETQFSQVQMMLKQARRLVWVTAPQDGTNDDHFPHYAVAQGFLRTVRAEMPESHIVSLSIEDVSTSKTREGIINKTIEVAFGASLSPELEYIFRFGQLHTARAVKNLPANDTLRALLHPRLQKLTWEDSPAIKLELGTPGVLESLRFEQDVAHEKALDPHDIEIEAKVWGLSRRDTLTAQGRGDDGYDGDGLGTDCSGVVTRVGKNCDSQGPKPGDRVVMLARGCMIKFPRAHETCVIRAPARSNIPSFEIASTALEPALTAYHAVIDVARVVRGDKVLVHEAVSATGQLAVQLAKMEGAEVLVTTSASPSCEREEKERNFLATTLGIAPEHIFSASHNTTSFAVGIKCATKGHGVDVVINTLAGDQLQASWQLLAPGGRFVDISLKDGALFPGADVRRRNTSFTAVDILDLPPRVTARLLKDTLTRLDEGKIIPPILTQVFSLTEVKKAFHMLQSGDGSGRVVLVPQPGDLIPQLSFGPRGPQRCRFDENATYVIPGGLGGLGRSILAWMAACGARHLIVPSRSGASAPAAAKLVTSLSSEGVDVVTTRCDITNEAALATLFEDSKKTMPPIRGVINCAMVLSNAVFARMSFQQWSSAVNAKVAASFNLHRLLDAEKLDFFIHLSSLASINGQMASSNYAGGCSFQDALARCYRGVTTLNVGWIADVGLIAETAAYQRQLKEWDNMQRIEARELLSIIGMVCGTKQAGKGGEAEGRPGQQVLVGLRTPADFRLRHPGRPLPPVLERPFLSTFSRPIGPVGAATSAKPSKTSPDKAAAVNHGALFRTAAEDKARASVVVSALSEKLARSMMMSADDVEPDRTLSAYGIDSLMAIDIRNWLHRVFCANLTILEIMGGQCTIKLIAERAVRKSTMLKS